MNKPASERLLALYPNLPPFDRQTAAIILEEQIWSEQMEALFKLPETATLQDLLAKFQDDRSKEEFLWFYIEAVTGEENIDLKKY
jgi:hypothetical protein